jgi:hypothetical protein
MRIAKQMVRFGMLLGLSSLLGCPPAAKVPDDTKQSDAPAGDAGATPTSEAPPASGTTGGGW